MLLCWIESVACTLVNSKRDIRTRVTREIEEHADDAGIVDGWIGRFTILILGRWGRFSRGVLFGGVMGVETKGFNDSFSET